MPGKRPAYQALASAGSEQLIDEALLNRTLGRAQSAPRLRANHNFHADATSNPHRFLNALVRGTYCPPHRHAQPPKSETFLALRGQVAVFLYADDGQVTSHYVLGQDGVYGIDIPAGVWHSIAALSETAVCFEVKPGPWDPESDKQFPPWAPREDEPGTAEYLARLLSLLTTKRV